MCIIFKRKIYQKLLEWKTRDKGKKALLIEGARRIGKLSKSICFLIFCHTLFMVFTNKRFYTSILLFLCMFFSVKQF